MQIDVLRLPKSVRKNKIKDVNDLAQIKHGEDIFVDLVSRRVDLNTLP